MLSSSLRRNAPRSLFAVPSMLILIRHNSAFAMLVRDEGPRPAALQTPEEIHIGKLLHLLHVGRLGNLLVIEENTLRCPLFCQLLKYESDVVASVDRTSLMTDNRLQLEVRW